MGDRDRSCGRGFGVVPAMGLVERSGGGRVSKGKRSTNETDVGDGSRRRRHGRELRGWRCAKDGSEGRKGVERKVLAKQ